MKMDISEKGLEALIVGHMTATGGWIAGNPNDYDRSYAIDLIQLKAFIAATQAELLEALDLDNDNPTRQKFLARMQGEITKRGVMEGESMWRASQLLLTLFLLVPTTCAQPARHQIELDLRVNNLLSEMTLEEKVGQLNLFDVDQAELDLAIAEGKVGAVLNAVGAAQTNKLQRLAIERSPLHIPLLFGYDVIHGYRTIFPLASTWDSSAVESMARIS